MPLKAAHSWRRGKQAPLPSALISGLSLAGRRSASRRALAPRPPSGCWRLKARSIAPATGLATARLKCSRSGFSEVSLRLSCSLTAN